MPYPSLILHPVSLDHSSATTGISAIPPDNVNLRFEKSNFLKSALSNNETNNEFKPQKISNLTFLMVLTKETVSLGLGIKTE